MFYSIYESRRNSYERNVKKTNINEKEKVNFFSVSWEGSSIYALSQISNSSFYPVKLFWTLIFSISLFGSIYKVQKFWKLYQEYPVVVNLRVEQAESLEFPAVSICNLNRMINGACLGKERSALLFSESRSLHNCKKLNNVTKSGQSGNGSDLKFLFHYYNLDEMERFSMGHPPWIFMEECSFGGKNCSQTQLNYLMSLRYGNCITFNKRNLNASNSLLTSETGIGSGLILKLNLQSVLYQMVTHTVGAKIIIHEPNEHPNLEEDGFIISPGYETVISIKQTIFHRLPAPYKDKCKDYKSEKREFMTSKNECVRFRIQEENIAECGCGDPTLTVIDNLKTCDITSKKQSCCLDEVLDKMSQTASKYNCPLPCSSVYYNENLSRSVLPYDNVREVFDSSANEVDDFGEDAYYDPVDFEYDSLEDDIDDKDENEIRNSNENDDNSCVFSKQQVRINVFYSVLERYVYEQQPKWTHSELLGYVGNEFGIWLGLSLMILVEFSEKIIFVLKNIFVALRAYSFDDSQI